VDEDDNFNQVKDEGQLSLAKRKEARWKEKAD
jgi:hypothetical protein